MSLNSKYVLAEEVSEDEVLRISYNLRCPVCQGLSVGESQSEISETMKDKVRDLLREGKSEEAIYTYFVERYGEWILREPQKKGSNWLIYIFPFAAIITVLFIIILRIVIRKKKQA